MRGAASGWPSTGTSTDDGSRTVGAATPMVGQAIPMDAADGTVEAATPMVEPATSTDTRTADANRTVEADSGGSLADTGATAAVFTGIPTPPSTAGVRCEA